MVEWKVFDVWHVVTFLLFAKKPSSQFKKTMLLDSTQEILKHVASLYKDEHTSDVTLFVGEERTPIKAHRIILRYALIFKQISH